MPKYKAIIFDCDGVILDSNSFKINAMRDSLKLNNFSNKEIELSIDYFRNNFGKSRFHHIQYFLENFHPNPLNQESLLKSILENYSYVCKRDYIFCNLTAGFQSIIKKIECRNLFVASGSDENELRHVFKAKGLSKYFELILGSPTTKSQNIKKIINMNPMFKRKEFLMIGDSISDYQSAEENGINFLAYLEYSQVKERMINLSKEKDFLILLNWSDLLEMI